MSLIGHCQHTVVVGEGTALDRWNTAALQNDKLKNKNFKNFFYLI